ncbi:Hypothetical predicted protein [Octopus vulgaris]|uniref:Uncharacterized protein n=1 Tax=Octopus vulgaris TaxID=6645 RepID=A0AA36AWY4_OCTVU|nr:Hypothetical predicted protein [Octopus vulgaris]
MTLGETLAIRNIQFYRHNNKSESKMETRPKKQCFLWTAFALVFLVLLNGIQLSEGGDQTQKKAAKGRVESCTG